MKSDFKVQRWSGARLFGSIGLGVCAWAMLAFLCLCIGPTGFGLRNRALFLQRWEPVMLASLVGAALAAAGVAYQAILRNPLADPYLLGASSGASLAAYLWQLPILAAAAGFLGPLAAASQQTFAFAGAIASVLIVLIVASRSGALEPITLLLVGVIMNAINGSIFLLLNSFHRDLPGNGGPMAFLVGGIQTVTAAQRYTAIAIILPAWILLLLLGGQLQAAGAGDSEAQSLGISVQMLRWTTLLLASLITGAAVAVSGPIGFVGLVCPHAARLLVGSDQRRLLPVATAIGAMLLMLADAVSRGLAGDRFIGTQLQVGIITSFLGGPFFLLLLWRRKC